MSFTLIATRSMPIVSCLPSSNASLSLVPTPSVPATRKESPCRFNRSAFSLRQHVCLVGGHPLTVTIYIYTVTIAIFIYVRTKGDHAAEAANARIELLDAAHELVASADVHAGIFVAEALAAGWRLCAAPQPLGPAWLRCGCGRKAHASPRSQARPQPCVPRRLVVANASGHAVQRATSPHTPFWIFTGTSQCDQSFEHTDTNRSDVSRLGASRRNSS